MCLHEIPKGISLPPYSHHQTDETFWVLEGRVASIHRDAERRSSRKLRGQKERAGEKRREKHEFRTGPHRVGVAQRLRGYTRPGPIPLPDRGKAPSIHPAAYERLSEKGLEWHLKPLIWWFLVAK